MASTDHANKSLDDIIKEDRAARKKASASKPHKAGGPARGNKPQRESPLGRRSEGRWSHDKHDEQAKKETRARTPKPPMTEEERGHKVQVTNNPLTVEELKTLVEGSELKHARVYSNKKVASLFFAKKEDAMKAIADFNGRELLDNAGASTWEFVEYKEPELRAEKQERAPKQTRAPREPKTGGKIDPKDVVISVRY